MEENKLNIEERLWEYIDGLGSRMEREAVEKMIAIDPQWKEKYNEFLELHQLVQASALEEPSLRFTKNIMEEIAKYHIAPATKNYINKKIIRGITIFFILMIAGFLIYGFGQIDWTTKTGTVNMPFEIPKIDLSKFFNNTYIKVFMMINVVLGLMLLDRYLASKKKKLQEEA